MNLNLTEEQIAVREAARDFAQNVSNPASSNATETNGFPADEVRQLGELGFMGMMVDPKYGGSGMDTVSYVLAMEEISKVDASTSVCMSVNNSWSATAFRLMALKPKRKVPPPPGHGRKNRSVLPLRT